MSPCIWEAKGMLEEWFGKRSAYFAHWASRVCHFLRRPFLSQFDLSRHRFQFHLLFTQLRLCFSDPEKCCLEFYINCDTVIVILSGLVLSDIQRPNSIEKKPTEKPTEKQTENQLRFPTLRKGPKMGSLDISQNQNWISVGFSVGLSVGFFSIELGPWYVTTRVAL